VTLKMKQTQKHKRLLIAGGVLAVMALCAAAWFGFTAMGNAQLEADSALEKPGSSSESVEKVTVTDDELSQLIKGDITLDSVLQDAGGIAFESDEESSSEKTEQTAGSEQAVSSQHSAASSKTIDKPQAESSPQKTQSAASASASASASSKPAPAGYEEELKALIRQVYAVKARAENGLNACIAESKAEYRALPKSQKTQTRKLMIVLSKSSELNALQASCDKEMDSIVSQMRTILQENGQSTALADQVMETYKAEKSARYTELKNKFYS
jgi:hypothetical protein